MKKTHHNKLASAICLAATMLPGCQSGSSQLLRSHAANAPQQPPAHAVIETPATHTQPPALAAKPPAVSIPATMPATATADKGQNVIQTAGAGDYFAAPWQESIAAGHEAFQAGDYAAARTHYERSLQQKPGQLNAQLHLARTLTRLGDIKSAEALYSTAVSQHPQSTSARNDLAMLCANQGRLPEAVKHLQEAIRLDPQSARYRANIARLLVELNRPEEAFANLSATNPTAVAYYNLGVLYQQQSRWAEARRQFQLAAQTDPAFKPARTAFESLGGAPAPAPQRQ